MTKMPICGNQVRKLVRLFGDSRQIRRL